MLFALLLANVAAVSSDRAGAQEPQTSVVFVPGITGSRLRDTTTGDEVWGPARRFLTPKDRGHAVILSLRPEIAINDPIEPSGTLFKIKFLTYTKEIYRPLRRALEEAGYSTGDLDDPQPAATLFFFAYDWRQDNLHAVRALDRALERLAEGTGRPDLDLMCQSNAARVCRYLVRFGAVDLDRAAAAERPEGSYRIRKLILVGASNGGSIRQLHELDRGRKYIFGGRYLGPESLFALRPLLGDLPADSEGLFVDEAGRELEVDLYAAETWVHYGWSIFDPSVDAELDDIQELRLFGSHDDRVRYLRKQLTQSLQLHRVLQSDGPDFPDTAYYLLLNESLPTYGRALLRRTDEGWETLFADDKELRKAPHLRALLEVPGDGHATLDSQRALAPQEIAAIAGEETVEGGHFEAITRAEAHAALLRFLKE